MNNFPRWINLDKLADILSKHAAELPKAEDSDEKKNEKIKSHFEASNDIGNGAGDDSEGCI